MKAELQGLELQAFLPLDDELPVDDSARGKRFEERRLELGKVAVQGLEVAALQVPLVPVPEDQDPEAVPLRLEDPGVAFGKSIDELREHGLDGRRKRKFHAEILAVLAPLAGSMVSWALVVMSR